MSNPRQRSQHLVHVPRLTTSDIIETFPDGFLVDQVNFLINETKSSIELVASYMFTERACRVQQLKIINRFNFNTKKWEKSSFYPKKYQNFHGCWLNISANDARYEPYHQNENLMENIFEGVLNATLNWIENNTVSAPNRGCWFGGTIETRRCSLAVDINGLYGCWLLWIRRFVKPHKSLLWFDFLYLWVIIEKA